MSKEKYEKLKEICEKDTRDVSLDELNEFDLKLEMKNDQNKKKIESKITKECIELVIEKYKLGLKYEDIFLPEYILERYLLFKIQSKLLWGNKDKGIVYSFDCDITDEVYDFYNITSSQKTDTLLSIQSYLSDIFGNIVISKDEFNNNSKVYNEFKEEFGFSVAKKTKEKKYRIDKAKELIIWLMNVDKIKKQLEKLGNELYNTILKFILYYHTIGNMSPCPPGRYYNIDKGRCKYDRLDIFKRADSFKNYKEWFEQINQNGNNTENEKNIKLYCLEEVYYLGEKHEKLKEVPKKKKEESVEEYFSRVNTYLNGILDVIKRRNIDVINKFQ